MTNKIIELFGWYGTVVILGAYALLSFGIIEAGSNIYQLLNLTGALGIIAVSISKKAYQPAVLNSAWAAIALFTLTKLFMK